jgi:hypothetical protein
MSSEEEILSERSMKLIREEAFKLVELRDKLQEALTVAETLHREPLATDIKEELQNVIEQIGRTFATRIYFRSIRNMPWPERLWRRVSEDRYLEISTYLSAVAAVLTGLVTATGFRAVEEVALKIWESLKNLFVSPAHAQAMTGLALDQKSVIQYFILVVISIGFFSALAILAFSNRADARKLAADMIKTILGVYVGMATKLVS